MATKSTQSKNELYKLLHEDDEDLDKEELAQRR